MTLGSPTVRSCSWPTPSAVEGSTGQPTHPVDPAGQELPPGPVSYYYMGMYGQNRQLAEFFQSIADSLTDQNANPHRIRAYRRAAASIRGLHEDVAAIAGRGELKTIPGIGRDLAAKIEEFLATGTVQAPKTAVTPLPPEIAAWTSLPGLSESLVQHLYGRLGIRTLDDLEALVRSHMLRTLPGLAVNEDSLLAAIRARRQR